MTNENQTEQEAENPVLPSAEVPTFADVMGLVSGAETSEEASEGGASPATPAPGDRSPAAPNQEPGVDAPAEGAAAEGDERSVPLESSQGAPTAIDATTLGSEWGRISSGLTERQTKELEQSAFEEIKEEHAKYFEALQQHPRLLVGKEVPSLTGEGTEILRDSQDAREWQEALKGILTKEVKDRASRKYDDIKPMMETLHNSVSIFQSNPDLVPGTKQFNRELADKFAKMAKPYELRVDNKLIGYTIPVQPLISSIRDSLTATPAAPAQPHRSADQPRTPSGQFAPPAAPPAEAPQVGITSQAGQSGGESEDFSTLFGTLGLPNLRI